MPSETKIFDRTDILKTIESEWLEGSGGSGVLLCTQKVGKSQLLEHIFSRHSESQEYIYCQINIDYLHAALRPGEKLSDEVFLGFFLRRLRSRFQALIAQGDERRQRMEETERRLENSRASPDPDATAHRAALESELGFSKRLLDEVSTLKELVQSIDVLLKQSEIVIPEVAEILYSLESMRKRVVLIIDDYHQMVKHPRFSKALFSFLRGASQQKHVITVVSSHLQLMDESLHGGDRERSQLFNHFNTRLLEPFKDDEADLFLEWPLPAAPPLSLEERNYLRELGGGLPYFLKFAREEFLFRNRPSGQEQRLKFESELAPVFEGAFRDLWLRCSPARRAILRTLAKGEVIDANNALIKELEKEGYMLGGKVFSRLFAEFVNRNPPEDPAVEPAVTAIIPYRIFPTALAYARSGEPLITFLLKNPTTENVSVQLMCKLGPYSDETVKLTQIPRQTEDQREELSVALFPDSVTKLVAPIRALIRYQAEWKHQKGDSKMRNDTKEVLVLPIDNFIFARRREGSRALIDFTWLIAAWVQKEEPALFPIREAARRKTPLIGYPKEGPDIPGVVRRQSEALYEALKEYRPGGLTYDNSASVFHKEATDFVQRVRLPHRILKEGAGNCLEGCVVFASLLSASDLHPIILFIPGHAIVGWKDRDSKGANWEFIDTTVLAGSTFEEARKKGLAYYEARQNQCDEWLESAPMDAREPREIKDLGDFAIPVLIHDTWMSHDVIPLPFAST